MCVCVCVCVCVRQCHPKMNIIEFVQVDVMAEQLYRTALDCTGVPKKVATSASEVNIQIYRSDILKLKVKQYISLVLYKTAVF